MKNDIFYLINQVETDPDHYDIQELTQSEKDEYAERILHKLKKTEYAASAGRKFEVSAESQIKKVSGSSSYLSHLSAIHRRSCLCNVRRISCRAYFYKWRRNL